MNALSAYSMLSVKGKTSENLCDQDERNIDVLSQGGGYHRCAMVDNLVGNGASERYRSLEIVGEDNDE